MYEDRTDLYLVDEARVRVTHVAGRFRLEDIAAGYVLLSTGDPWPRVSIIEESLLSRSLNDGTIASTR